MKRTRIVTLVLAVALVAVGGPAVMADGGGPTKYVTNCKEWKHRKCQDARHTWHPPKTKKKPSEPGKGTGRHKGSKPGGWCDNHPDSCK